MIWEGLNLLQALGADSSWYKPVRIILLGCQSDWVRYPNESQLMCDILLLNKIGLGLYLGHWVSTSGMLRASWNKMSVLFWKKSQRDYHSSLLDVGVSGCADWNCCSHVATKKKASLKMQFTSWSWSWNMVHIVTVIFDLLNQIKTRLTW